MKQNMSELINCIASTILLIVVLFSHRMLYHFLEGFPGVNTELFLWLKNNIKEAEKFNRIYFFYIKTLDSCLQNVYKFDSTCKHIQTDLLMWSTKDCTSHKAKSTSFFVCVTIFKKCFIQLHVQKNKTKLFALHLVAYVLCHQIFLPCILWFTVFFSP